MGAHTMSTWSRARKRVSDILYQAGPAQYYQPAYRQIASSISLETGSFLDVGCGPGWLCMHVAGGRPQIDAVGIDHSEKMVEVARRNKGGRLNITIRSMDASAIKFPEATFDVAAAVQTAHHWVDVESVLSEVFRVLKSGGWFYLYEADRAATAVPAGWIERWKGWPPDKVVINGWQRFGMNDDEWAELQSCVRSIGFSEQIEDRHGFYRRLVLQK